MSERAAPRAPQSAQTAKKGLFRTGLEVIGTLLFALLLSILIEWTGMVAGWWAADGSHSTTMLQQEIAYLEQDFPTSLGDYTAASVASRVGNKTFDVIAVDTGLVTWMAKMQRVNAGLAPKLIRLMKAFYEFSAKYLIAAVSIIQLFVVRLAIISLSIPLMVLVCAATFADGVVQRELRKAGGGREYGMLYHQIKAWINPIVLMPAVLYLASPWPTHPNWVFFPSALVLGLLFYALPATFKKYI